MKIEIVPVAEFASSSTKVKYAERGGLGGQMRTSPFCHEPSLQEAIEPVQSEIVNLEDIFAKFLQQALESLACRRQSARSSVRRRWCRFRGYHPQLSISNQAVFELVR